VKEPEPGLLAVAANGFTATTSRLGWCTEFAPTASPLQSRRPQNAVHHADSKKASLARWGITSVSLDETVARVETPINLLDLGEMDHAASNGARLSRSLPVTLILSRLAQSIKVVHKENMGAWHGSKLLQQGLASWLTTKLADWDGTIPPVGNPRFQVDDHPDAGWYRFELVVDVLVSGGGSVAVTGRLDKE
jgi:predicted component of type VI protein secretion system